MVVDFAARTVRRLLVAKEQRFVFTRKENMAIPPLNMQKIWLSHNRACCLVAHVTASEEHL